MFNQTPAIANNTESVQLDRNIDGNNPDAITLVEAAIVHRDGSENLLEDVANPTASLNELSVDEFHECEVCSDKFTTSDGLNEHKLVKHTENHNCHLCDKMFVNQECLTNHKISDHTDCNECHICGKTLDGMNVQKY